MNIGDMEFTGGHSDISINSKRCITPINLKYEIDIIQSLGGSWHIYVEHIGTSKTTKGSLEEIMLDGADLLTVQCVIHEMCEKYK